MIKPDLALNKLQGLICDETKANKQGTHCLPDKNHSLQKLKYLYLLNLTYDLFQLYYKVHYEDLENFYLL